MGFQSIHYFTVQKCLVRPVCFGTRVFHTVITILISVLKHPLDSFPQLFYSNLKVAKIHQQLSPHTSC